MPFLRVAVRVPNALVDAVDAAFEACGAIAVSIEDAADEPLFQRELDTQPMWRNNRVLGLFPLDGDIAAIRAGVLQEAGAHAAIDVELVPDEDWARAWLAHFKPLKFGERLWVYPTWCEPPEPAAVNVMLDPGLAFGTGTHATTSLCLEWLAQQPALDRLPAMIDFGCGSGILAIAALKLGAARAYGVDIDPRALEASAENAARNGVAERLLLYHSAQTPARLGAPLVIANVLAEPLISLSETIKTMVVHDGILLLSGLLRNQRAEVERAYRDFRFTGRTREDWLLLIGRRA